jgi:MFS transporter, DHA3 family, macrolide efflux protein
MRNFFTVWAGQAISLLGSQLVQFSLIWWLTSTTGSATVLAMATLVGLLPQILLAPYAGALVDRWSRKKIMIAADLGIAFATLILIVLFWLNLAGIWAIFLILILRSAGSAFHWPAMQATTTLMVPVQHLGRIGGLNQALSGTAGIFIPPLGALAMQALPMQTILSIDIVTAIPAVAALLIIPIPQPPRQANLELGAVRPRLRVEMRQGLNFILGWKALLGCAIIGVLVNLLGQAAGSLMPILVIKHFQGGVAQLGWIQAASGIGFVAGGALLGIWGGSKRKIVAQMIALALDGLVIVAVALCSPNDFGWAVLLIAFSGLFEAVAIGLGGALGQILIPPEMQGRVFGLILSATQALAPLGLLAAGPYTDHFGVQSWWILTGVILFLIGTVTLLIPAMVQVEERSPYARAAV